MWSIIVLIAAISSVAKGGDVPPQRTLDASGKRALLSQLNSDLFWTMARSPRVRNMNIEEMRDLHADTMAELLRMDVPKYDPEKGLTFAQFVRTRYKFRLLDVLNSEGRKKPFWLRRRALGRSGEIELEAKTTRRYGEDLELTELIDYALRSLTPRNADIVRLVVIDEIPPR